MSKKRVARNRVKLRAVTYQFSGSKNPGEVIEVSGVRQLLERLCRIYWSRFSVTNLIISLCNSKVISGGSSLSCASTYRANFQDKFRSSFSRRRKISPTDSNSIFSSCCDFNKSRDIPSSSDSRFIFPGIFVEDDDFDLRCSSTCNE